MKTSQTDVVTLEQREEALYEKLRLQGMVVKPKNAWRQSLGRAKGDAHFESAMRLGAQWRDEENRRSLEEKVD
jgi:hypothetical protein